MEIFKKTGLNTLFYMLRKDIKDIYSKVLIGYISITALFLSFFIVICYIGFPLIILDNFFIIGLFLVGFFFSGMSFPDFRSKEKSIFYLCLPASPLQKFFSVFIFSTLGIILSYILVFFLFNSLAVFLGKALFSMNVRYVDITGQNIINYMLLYCSYQSLFLVGAVSFKRIPVVVTGGLIMLAGILLFVYSGFLHNRIISDIPNIETVSYQNFLPEFTISFVPMYLTGNLFFEISAYILKFVIPMLLWYVVYLKLKNKILK